jgi:hypothetical protein
LAKVLSNDPKTEFTDGLQQSSSHPNTTFAQGGGFTAVTKSTRTLQAAEVQAALDKKIAGWEKAPESKRGPRPTATSVKTAIPDGGSIEFHPGGGIHSNYQQRPDVNGRGFGSYNRVRSQLHGTETRIGRHGAFHSDETFEGAPLPPFGGKKAADKIADLSPPVETNSPPPSPRTARSLTNSFYERPVETLAALTNTAHTYRQIDAHLNPPPAAFPALEQLIPSRPNSPLPDVAP